MRKTELPCPRALGAIALLLVPLQASAWSYTLSQGSTTWNDITGHTGTVVLATASGHMQVTGPTAYPVPLPFQFYFDGSSYGALTAYSNGWLTFDQTNPALTETDQIQDGCGGFPYSSGDCPPPTTLIAPWWGDLELCFNASLQYLVAGATGSRTLIVQWTNANTDNLCDDGFFQSGYDAYSFQAVLHEGSGEVDFIYGPSTQGSGVECEQSPTGSCVFAGGIEDGPSGMPDLGCNGACTASDFPDAGSSYVFVAEPDVRIAQLQTPGSAVQGGSLLATLQLDNLGGPASGATGSLYYSTDGGTFDSSQPLAAYGPLSIAAGAMASVPVTVTLPATAPLGTGWIIATLSVPADSDPAGKQVASPPFDVLADEPDLEAVGLVAPSTGNAGAAISLGLTVKNSGGAPAANVPYSYFLSSTPTVSPNDLEIGGGTIATLAAGGTYTSSDQAQLPASLPAGSYTVGVIVNPARTIAEYSYSGDWTVATPPMLVSAGPLAISTTQLPPAAVGAPYQAVLVASGGGGVYTWSLSSGTLPAGIQLTSGGTLIGTPSTAGSSSFAVAVADQDAHTATATLGLTVSAQGVPLQILTRALPGGSFGIGYSVALVAIGGAPPYQWSLASSGGAPPPGIGLSTDGTLAGTPEADGAFVFQVQVTDSAGATAQSAPFDLEVLSPGRVGVAEAALPQATEGVSYSGTLLATGGTPPYTWALLDDVELPSGPGDQGQDLQAAMPAGLALDPSGDLSGIATVTGTFALTVQVTDSSTPPVSESDTVLLNVLPGAALSILNPTVPDATVGRPYSDTLETNATNATVTFAVVDGLGNASDAARQSLPPGITLDPTGVLAGTPAASATGSARTTYDFLVKAADGTGRIAVVAIALTVDPVPASGGCASSSGRSGGDVGGFTLVVLLCLGLRRRTGPPLPSSAR